MSWDWKKKNPRNVPCLRKNIRNPRNPYQLTLVHGTLTLELLWSGMRGVSWSYICTPPPPKKKLATYNNWKQCIHNRLARKGRCKQLFARVLMGWLNCKNNAALQRPQPVCDASMQGFALTVPSGQPVPIESNGQRSLNYIQACLQTYIHVSDVVVLDVMLHYLEQWNLAHL